MEQPEEPISYLQQYANEYKQIKESAGQISVVTGEFDSNELPENAVAVHPIYGIVFADGGRWWDNIFSTKQFIKNIQAADNNENIIAHFMPTKTPGGDAHYLDLAAKAVRELKKPSVTQFERIRASAGVYLTTDTDEIYANSKFDRSGSIGTMISALDFTGIWTKLGATYVEEYATLSTMKNKIENDLLKGDPKEYKLQVLDPLNNAFIETVRNSRAKIKDVKEDAPVVSGAMFYADQAIEVGLIDGIMSQSEAINRAYDLGMENDIKNLSNTN